MRGVRGRNLIAVDYEPVEQVLVCRFAKSGEYRYKGVPENVFQSLLKVPYADSYFTKVVKGKYPVIKPEKVNNGNTQDTQRRICDGGASGNVGERKPIDGSSERHNSGNRLPDGGRDVTRQRGREVDDSTMQQMRNGDNLSRRSAVAERVLVQSLPKQSIGGIGKEAPRPEEAEQQCLPCPELSKSQTSNGEVEVRSSRKEISSPSGTKCTEEREPQKESLPGLREHDEDSRASRRLLAAVGSSVAVSPASHGASRDAGSAGGRVVEFYRQQDGLTFEPDGHIYKLDGKRVISLTQILDAAGLVDYSGTDPQVLANKAKFGTKVHEYCLWLDQNELDMDDLKPYPNYWNRVEGWRQFAEDFNFVCDMKWCEVPCAVKVNGMTFAMTVDRFGFTGPAADPVPTIVEIKTCADREFHHQVQTAAQTIPFRGDGSVPVKRGAVYLLDKPNASKKLYFYQPHEDRMDEKIFMAALILTQTRINHKLLKGY